MLSETLLNQIFAAVRSPNTHEQVIKNLETLNQFDQGIVEVSTLPELAQILAFTSNLGFDTTQKEVDTALIEEHSHQSKALQLYGEGLDDRFGIVFFTDPTQQLHYFPFYTYDIPPEMSVEESIANDILISQAGTSQGDEISTNALLHLASLFNIEPK